MRIYQQTGATTWDHDASLRRYTTFDETPTEADLFAALMTAPTLAEVPCYSRFPADLPTLAAWRVMAPAAMPWRLAYDLEQQAGAPLAGTLRTRPAWHYGWDTEDEVDAYSIPGRVDQGWVAAVFRDLGAPGVAVYLAGLYDRQRDADNGALYLRDCVEAGMLRVPKRKTEGRA